MHKIHLLYMYPSTVTTLLKLFIELENLEQDYWNHYLCPFHAYFSSFLQKKNYIYMLLDNVWFWVAVYYFMLTIHPVLLKNKMLILDPKDSYPLWLKWIEINTQLFFFLLAVMFRANRPLLVFNVKCALLLLFTDVLFILSNAENWRQKWLLR